MAYRGVHVQEDTILFHLIERAQFKRNPCVYQEGAQFLEVTSPASSPVSSAPLSIQTPDLHLRQVIV